MKELEKAIDACVSLKDDLDSHYRSEFGEKVRLLGAFMEDDFENVISKMEDSRDRIEELEAEVEELKSRIQELEDEIANAE